jgi:hypothetical protein
MTLTEAQKKRLTALTFFEVYPHYVAKVVRKGRTEEELHQVIEWLTGYSVDEVKKHASDKVSFEHFFQEARVNPYASLVKGVICGYRVEEMEDPLCKLIRCLDKLVDELAKGKKMEKILRKPNPQKAFNNG